MWTIRQAQVEAFVRNELKKFEDDMVGHLKKFFPEKCESMGEPHVREMFRYGVERARTYGITLESDISVFVDIMFVLGKDFDLREENAWALRILDARSSATERVMQLCDATVEYLTSKEEANAGT